MPKYKREIPKHSNRIINLLPLAWVFTQNTVKDVVIFIGIKIISRFRKLKRLINNGGPEILSNSFNTYCARNYVKHDVTPLYHPQANGYVKLLNRLLVQLLSKMKHDKTSPNMINGFCCTPGTLRLHQMWNWVQHGHSCLWGARPLKKQTDVCFLIVIPTKLSCKLTLALSQWRKSHRGQKEAHCQENLTV